MKTMIKLAKQNILRLKWSLYFGSPLIFLVGIFLVVFAISTVPELWVLIAMGVFNILFAVILFVICKFYILKFTAKLQEEELEYEKLKEFYEKNKDIKK